jgi:hypothetical protein
LKTLKITTLFLISLLGSLALPLAAGQNRKLLVGKIKDKSLVEGCGCAFQLPADSKRRNRSYIYSDDLDGTAWMNIDGHDIEFKLVRTIATPRDQDRARRGDRTVQEYKGAEITLILSHTITQPCRVNDESCEWVGMTAELKLSDGKRTKLIKTIGGCGC